MSTTLCTFIPFTPILQSYGAIVLAHLMQLQDEFNHPLWVSSSVTLQEVQNNAIGAIYHLNSPLCHEVEVRLLEDGIEVLLHSTPQVDLRRHAVMLDHLVADTLMAYLPTVVLVTPEILPAPVADTSYIFMSLVRESQTKSPAQDRPALHS